MKMFALVLSAAVLAGCGGARTEDATAEFKPLVNKVSAAWTTLDPDKVAPYFAKDPGLAFYDIAPLKYRGWQEYSEGSRKLFAGWQALTLTVGPDLQVHKNGDVAWATFTFDFEITPKTGEHMKGTARISDVFEKRGDNWLIVHEHVSIPWMEPQKPEPPAKKPAAHAPAHKKSKQK